jgi:hypothetical protein
MDHKRRCPVVRERLRPQGMARPCLREGVGRSVPAPV